MLGKSVKVVKLRGKNGVLLRLDMWPMTILSFKDLFTEFFGSFKFFPPNKIVCQV